MLIPAFPKFKSKTEGPEMKESKIKDPAHKEDPIKRVKFEIALNLEKSR
jgi:hypothetical protein